MKVDEGRALARDVLEAISAAVIDELPEVEARRYSIRWKPDGSPVTDADVYLETLIEARLRESLGDLTFLGEETFAADPGAVPGWTAVLDPIDGTENFCSGLPVWGTSLSLWRDGVHRGSMLLLPELGRRLITGDEVTLRRSRITGFSSSISRELVEELLVVGEGRVTGCAVFNLYSVITGTFARFVNPVGAYSWDLLAGLMLAAEQRCEVYLDGQLYDGGYLAPGRRYRVDIRR